MIIVANWKMNGNFALIDTFSSHLKSSSLHTIILCPPHPLLPYAKHVLQTVFIGAQDCHAFNSGAHTGFVSPKLIHEVGCTYVILGHSERRHMETNEDIRAKAQAAMEASLIPIICVGESLEVRERAAHISFVLTQVKESTKNLKGPYIIAYEPIWAIGTGKVCAPVDIQAMHQEIKGACPGVKVLYGGSVKALNAKELATLDHVDGFLVGGASLDVHEFNKIVNV